MRGTGGGAGGGVWGESGTYEQLIPSAQARKDRRQNRQPPAEPTPARVPSATARTDTCPSSDSLSILMWSKGVKVNASDNFDFAGTPFLDTVLGRS